jgi:Flp pilus assembly protein TadB
VIGQNEMRMELPNIRTWLMFYLISFVGLLWATFLSVQGVMLWVSLFLVIVIVGINFFTLYNQLKLRESRKEMLRNLVQGFERGQPDDDSKKTQ